MVPTQSEEHAMPLNIDNEEINRLAKALAERLGLTEMEAVKRALENELHRSDQRTSLRDRIRPIQERIAARPATGQKADKSFFDDLNASSSEPDEASKHTSS
jgi:antitoxin VapB